MNSEKRDPIKGAEMHGAEWEAQLSAYVDGELTDEEARVVSVHLADCPACRKEVEEMKRVASLVGGLPKEKAPAGVADEVLDRIESRRKTRERVAHWARVLMPAAAVILIAVALSHLYPENRSDTRQYAVAPTSPALRDFARPSSEEAGRVADGRNDELAFKSALPTEASTQTGEAAAASSAGWRTADRVIILRSEDPSVTAQKVIAMLGRKPAFSLAGQARRSPDEGGSPNAQAGLAGSEERARNMRPPAETTVVRAEIPASTYGDLLKELATLGKVEQEERNEKVVATDTAGPPASTALEADVAAPAHDKSASELARLGEVKPLEQNAEAATAAPADRKLRADKSATTAKPEWSAEVSSKSLADSQAAAIPLRVEIRIEPPAVAEPAPSK